MNENITCSPASRRPARTRLFALIALSLPLAVFVLLEVGLRVAGFGRDYPLFVPSPAQSGYLQANPEVIKRYFARPETAPAVAMETAYFRQQKQPGTFRVFVQGGSSAAGFPYGLGASLAGMLEQRLRRVFPGRDIEVVSTAMSAVNSYTLLDFADEVIAERPDAVLIYAGHNEFLGVYGVGSAFSSGTSRTLTLLAMRLRHFRVYQLVERLVAVTSRHESAGAPAEAGTLMARVARERQIPLGSALYEQGVNQFRGNLRALLGKYARAGIPVFVGTLASNERDQAPFTTGFAPETDQSAWQQYYDAAATAAEQGQLALARASLEDAIALDEGAADAWFALGRLLEAEGDATAAREAYLAALDRDQLRFRAPRVLNEVIREVAAETGATVVDVLAVMAGASDGGIVGKELMLEHLHPNLDGYFYLADAFFDALLAAGMPDAAASMPDDALARLEVPVSELDRLFGEYKVLRITADWPFQSPRVAPVIPEPTNFVEELTQELYYQRTSWVQAMRQLQEYYQRERNQPELTRVALILADAFPWIASQQFTAGTALIREGRPAESLRYLERAAEKAPDDRNVLLAHSHALILTGQYAEARPKLERVLQQDPRNVTARNALEQLARVEARRAAKD